MRFILSAPAWSWLFAPLLAAAILLFFRMGRRREVVPTLQFWREAGAIVQKSAAWRKVDWLWTLALLAGAVAALGLCRPVVLGKRRAAALAHLNVDIAIAQAPGAKAARMFARLRAGASPKAAAQGEIRATGAERDAAVSKFRVARHITGAALDRGVIMRLPDKRRVLVTVSMRGFLPFRLTLKRQALRKFGLIAVGHPNRALVRAFTAQRGAAPNDATRQATVWLAHGAGGVARYPTGPGVIVVEGGGDVKGLTVGTSSKAMTNARVVPSAAAGRLLHDVKFAHVHVYDVLPVRSHKGWRVLARVGRRPWILTRRDAATRQRWIYIAGGLRSSETDWPRTASFVIFFSNVAREALGGVKIGGVTRWRTVHKPAPTKAGVKASSRIALADDCYGIAAALAAVAAWLLSRRAGGARNYDGHRHI